MAWPAPAPAQKSEISDVSSNFHENNSSLMKINDFHEKQAKIHELICTKCIISNQLSLWYLRQSCPCPRTSEISRSPGRERKDSSIASSKNLDKHARSTTICSEDFAHVFRRTPKCPADEPVDRRLHVTRYHAMGE